MKIIRKLKKGVFFTGGVLVLSISGVTSVFLAAAGYESVYNRSLPLVHTIDSVDLSAFKQSYDLYQAIVKDNKQYGSYGIPVTLKLPQRSARLDIVQPLHEDQSWLARANTLHMLVPKEPRDGNIGVALLYCRTGFRTITGDTLPSVGSNIFIDTDRAWRYVYKITSTSLAQASRTYVIADGGESAKLLISCFDSATATNAYIEATLLSVQGIDT